MKGMISVSLDSCIFPYKERASLVTQMVKNLPTMQEIRVQSLNWEDPLEEGMAMHSSLLAWRILTEREAWRSAFMGSQTVGHNWATKLEHEHTQKSTEFLNLRYLVFFNSQNYFWCFRLPALCFKLLYNLTPTQPSPHLLGAVRSGLLEMLPLGLPLKNFWIKHNY